jgi:hypothetical protein
MRSRSCTADEEGHGRGGDLAFTVPAGVRLVFVADSSGAITFPTSGGRSWRRIK